MRISRWQLLWTATLLLLPAAQAQRQEPAAPVKTKPLGTFRILDLDHVAPLAPRVTLFEQTSATSGEPRLSSADFRRYGFDKRAGGYTISSDDPNGDYRRARPFGEMEVLIPEQPYINSQPGVLAVQAFRTEWPRPGNLEVRRKATIWRWDVPEAWRDTYQEWSKDVNHARYRSLCLPWPGWKRDPGLFLFDGASGLRWQADVPLRDALLEYALRRSDSSKEPVDLKGAQSTGDRSGLVFTQATHDGSRVLVSVGWARPVLTLLFLYDHQGKLLQTTILPKCVVGAIDRAPSADLFVLNASRSGIETFLLDGDGTLLGRFVDDQGRNMRLSMLSDTHAYFAYTQKRQDGTTEHRKLLYELSKK